MTNNTLTHLNNAEHALRAIRPDLGAEFAQALRWAGWAEVPALCALYQRALADTVGGWGAFETLRTLAHAATYHAPSGAFPGPVQAALI